MAGQNSGKDPEYRDVFARKPRCSHSPPEVRIQRLSSWSGKESSEDKGRKKSEENLSDSEEEATNEHGKRERTDALNKEDSPTHQHKKKEPRKDTVKDTGNTVELSSSESEDENEAEGWYKDLISTVTYWEKEIILATSRETSNKLSITRADQARVREGLRKIQGETTKAATRMGRMEILIHTLKENNTVLQQELKEIKNNMAKQNKSIDEIKAILKNQTEKREQQKANEPSDREMGNIFKILEQQATQMENIRRGQNEYRQRRHEKKTNEQTDKSITTDYEGDSETSGEPTAARRGDRRRTTNSNRNQRTYAQATKIQQKQEGWKTPETTPQWQTVVRRKHRAGEEDKTIDVKTVKKDLLKTYKGGPLKYIGENKNKDTVIIQCNNEEQRKTITQALRTNESYEVKENSQHRPAMILTGIDKGYTDEEFIDLLVDQNEHILGQIDTKQAKEELKIPEERAETKIRKTL